MKRDIHCKHSILERDVICEHKFARIEPESIATLHNHDGYEVILFLGGDVNLYVESDEKKLARGDLVFINSYIFHGIKLTDIESYERIVLNVRESYLKQLNDEDVDLSVCFQRMPSKNLNVIHLEEPEINEYISIAEKLEKNIYGHHYGHSILIKAFLSELMVMANRCASKHASLGYLSEMPPIVIRTFDYIEENLTSHITVESLAKKLNYNSDYLSRTFRDATGSSLKHFISAKKISLAQSYLRQGYSPYDVCFMTGFNNYSSFSRRFSEQVGISPKQYQLEGRI